MDEAFYKKIEELRLKWPGQDNQQWINQAVSRYRELVTDKKALDTPVFKKFAAEATKALNELSALLMNDESLLNEKGVAVSRERNFFRMMVHAFGIEAKDNALAFLIEGIDEKL